MSHLNSSIKERFRGFLPVVVDVETAGIDPEKNALLEACIVFITQDNQGRFHPGVHHFEHILPFEGAQLDEKSLAFNQIDPFQPLRFALDEKTALSKLFKPIKQAIKAEACQRAVSKAQSEAAKKSCKEETYRLLSSTFKPNASLEKQTLKTYIDRAYENGQISAPILAIDFAIIGITAFKYQHNLILSKD